MYDIVTLGSATVDVFASTSSELVKFVTPQGEKDFIAYPSGSKILVSDVDFLVGGGGTNTAVSFSRMGLHTAFIGKIGVDDNSYKVLQLLERENIDFLGTKEGQTGYSIVLDSIENDRTILTFKGSNNTLQFTDISLGKIYTKWLYSSSMVGESFETLKKLFFYLHAQGVHIAFNPSSYQAKQGVEKLKDVLSICEVLILNLEEAALLLGHEGTIHQLAQQLQETGPKIVIITNGSKGATCYTQETFYDIEPTPHLNVVETTGAGDAFGSGFVTGLYYKLSIEDSLRIGMIQAESVIQFYGAKNNLLDKETAFTHLKNFQGHLQKETLFEHNKHKDHAKLSTLDSPWLFKSPKEQAFKLANGQIIQSLEELAYSLKYLSDVIFAKHVNKSKNDFANWIEYVFSLQDLADDVRQLAKKEEMSKSLIKYVKSQHKL